MAGVYSIMKARILPILTALAMATAANAEMPEKARAELEQLMEKAKQAKSEGRMDEAEELHRQMKKLAGEFREREGEKGDQLTQKKRHVEELRAAGKYEDAERLEKRSADAREREHAKLMKSPGEGPERMRHLRQAIEHLRAAGLNDVAENLEEQARKMHEEFAHRGDKPGPGHPESEKMHGPMREMHAGMQEMRGELRKMAQAIEELRRQQKKERENE